MYTTLASHTAHTSLSVTHLLMQTPLPYNPHSTAPHTIQHSLHTSHGAPSPLNNRGAKSGGVLQAFSACNLLWQISLRRILEAVQVDKLLNLVPGFSMEIYLEVVASRKKSREGTNSGFIVRWQSTALTPWVKKHNFLSKISSYIDSARDRHDLKGGSSGFIARWQST